MRLSDIMSAAGLAFYAEVALALFIIAFVLVALMTLARQNQATWERARFIPLSEDGQQHEDPNQRQVKQ